MFVHTTNYASRKCYFMHNTALSLTINCAFYRGSRSCGCSYTYGAYGGPGGHYFADVTTNPCSVNIRNIYIQSGGVVDAIQIQYQYLNGRYYTAPLRGGGGGTRYRIPVYTGEKIIGVFGSTGVWNTYTVVSRLYFVKETTSGSALIYGPYGERASANTFVVIGDIKSIYGRYGGLLDAIGFHYNKWGCE